MGKYCVFSECIYIHLNYSSSSFQQNINYQLCCQMLHVTVFSIRSQGKRKVIGYSMGRNMPGDIRMEIEGWYPPSLPSPQHPPGPGSPGLSTATNRNRGYQSVQNMNWVSNSRKETVSFLFVKPHKLRQEKIFPPTFWWPSGSSSPCLF